MGRIGDKFGGKKTGHELHMVLVFRTFGETEDRHTWVGTQGVLMERKTLKEKRGWMSKAICIAVLALLEITCCTDICMWEERRKVMMY